MFSDRAVGKKQWWWGSLVYIRFSVASQGCFRLHVLHEVYTQQKTCRRSSCCTASHRCSHLAKNSKLDVLMTFVCLFSLKSLFQSNEQEKQIQNNKICDFVGNFNGGKGFRLTTQLPLFDAFVQKLCTFSPFFEINLFRYIDLISIQCTFCNKHLLLHDMVAFKFCKCNVGFYQKCIALFHSNISIVLRCNSPWKNLLILYWNISMSV